LFIFWAIRNISGVPSATEKMLVPNKTGKTVKTRKPKPIFEKTDVRSVFGIWKTDRFHAGLYKILQKKLVCLSKRERFLGYGAGDGLGGGDGSARQPEVLGPHSPGKL
jgi:hypothetical protein